jgi:uncharacterized OB-fold protein
MNPNFNLPPGCTGKDVDEAAGDFKLKCDECGHWFWTRNPERNYCQVCSEEKES